MAKRLLFLEDLYDFYLKQNKSCNFSAKETGYQLSVQVPAYFDIENDTNDDSLLFCKVKLMHSGENKNHSSVTDEALKKAAKGLAYKPILANFMEYTDENTGETLKDFTSHDFIVNDDGSTTYLEHQIGCFTSDEPFFEVEQGTGHNFLYGYCAIPKEYTEANSIIKRKNGTKVSVELAVNELSWNNTSKVLELTDVVIMGATCLGKDPITHRDVGEGMQGARLNIADFSTENNTVKFNKDEKLIELMESLNKTLSVFNNNGRSSTQDNSEKGGNETNMFKKLLEKYNKTVEDVTFEYENMSDEELEAKFEEVFGENDNTDNTDTTDNTVDNTEDNTDDNGETSDGDNTGEQFTEKTIRTYELSHDDIRMGLYNLLMPYEEANNDYYWITSVYDTYFVYESYATSKLYGQAYTKTDDAIVFDGERYELFIEYLTVSEKAELEAMRSNYTEITAKLEKYEAAEIEAKKTELLNSDDYSSVKDNEAFAELVSNHTDMTFEELQEKCDKILLDTVKAGKFSFAENGVDNGAKKKMTSVKMFTDPNNSKSTKPSRYGNLFKK